MSEISKKFHELTRFDPSSASPDVKRMSMSEDSSAPSRKKYPRLKKVKLPKKDSIEILKNIYLEALPGKPHLKRCIPDGVLSAILCSATISTEACPMEIYLIIQKAEKIEKGVYHYNAADHSLELLSKDLVYTELSKRELPHPWTENATAMFLITVIWDQIPPFPKEQGYRLALLGAGRLGQRLAVAARSLGIHAKISSDFIDQHVSEILDIESETEIPLNMVTLE